MESENQDEGYLSLPRRFQKALQGSVSYCEVVDVKLITLTLALSLRERGLLKSFQPAKPSL